MPRMGATTPSVRGMHPCNTATYTISTSMRRGLAVRTRPKVAKQWQLAAAVQHAVLLHAAHPACTAPLILSIRSTQAPAAAPGHTCAPRSCPTHCSLSLSHARTMCRRVGCPAAPEPPTAL